MGKTNFTFVPKWLLVSIAILLVSFHNIQAQGQSDLVIATNAEITLPACVDEITYYYLFTVVDDDPNGNTLSTPTISNLGLAYEGPNLIDSYDDGSFNYATYELVVTVNGAGSDCFTITYEGESVNPCFDVTKSPLDLPFIAFNQQTVTIPECSDGENVTFGATILSCDGDAINPARLSIVYNGVDYVDQPGFYQNGNYVEVVVPLGIDDLGFQIFVVSYTDANGNTESFDPAVTVLGRKPTTNYENLSCSGEVNIRLSNDCKAYLHATQLLNGAVVCDQNFYVHAVNVINGRSYINEDGVIEWGCGRYIYRVYNAQNDQLICWGYVNAEDKTAPVFEYCPSDKAYGQRTTRVYKIEGELGENTAADADNFNAGSYDLTFDPTIQTCFRTTSLAGFPVLDVLGKYRYFDLHEFRVERTGVYTFMLGTDFAYSGLAAIYAGAKDDRPNTRAPFDPYQPCSDIIAFGDYTFAPGPWSGLGEYLNFIGNLNGWSVYLSGLFYGGQGDSEPTIRVQLRAGQVYTLLTSSTREYDGGDYTWLVFPPQNDPNSRVFAGRSGSTQLAVQSQDAAFVNPLICTDIEQLQLPSNKCYTVDKDGNVLSISSSLRAVLEQTGYPHNSGEYEELHYFHGTIWDNCGDITICVSDVELDHDPYDYSYLGDCDYRVIKRTFTATDECGGLRAEPCHQYLFVRKPTMEDVVLPHYTAYIECDETYATIAGTDRPSPEATGYPFVVTAFGHYQLGTPGAQVYCNIAATFTDKARVDVCSESFYFIREWTVTDWCNPGRTIIYNQLIKVGDFTAPEVGELPQDPWDCAPTFSTGPFQCKSNFVVPTPDGISDNCSADGIKITVDIIAFLPEYDDHGFLTGDYYESTFAAGLKPGQVVNNVPKGLHLFKYQVEDGCKNRVVKYYWFQVVDRSEPVAQCDDFLNVSLSGQTVNGSTRIYAADIDEGSYDDCGPIKLRTRRSFADDACADQYAQLFYGVSLASLRLYTGVNAIDLSPYFTYNGEPLFYYHERLTVLGIPNANGSLNTPVFTVEGGKKYSLLNEYVDILCCDVKDSVTIELWVFDDANMDGIPGNYAAVEYGDYGDWIYGLCENGEARSDYYYPCAPDCGPIWDNHNVCWMEVLIEDKAKPICKPPQNITIKCTDDRVRYEDAFTCADSLLLNEFFGEFIGVDNCEVYMECIDVDDDRDNCGVGYITRYYQAVDGWGNRSAICSQTITVVGEHNYIIGFPADAEGACAEVLDTCVYLLENACDLLTVNIEDRRFTGTPGGECYKIERIIRVLNWCEYDGQSAPTIVPRDVDGDGKPGDEDIWVIRRPTIAYYDRAGSSANNWTQNLCGTPTLPNENLTPPSTSETNWESSAPSDTRRGNPLRPDNAFVGYWQYTQFIKVYDDIDPIVTAEPVEACSYSSDIANGCPAPVDVPFVVEENCTPNDLTIKVFLDAFTNGTIDADSRVESGNTLKARFGASVTGTYPNFVISGGKFPLGDHLFEVHVLDGCGNSTVARIPFSVVDCKAPTPICINGLAVELMPVIPAEDVDGDGDADTGAMGIWAEDFADVDKITDCTGPVKLAIYRSDDPVLADSTFTPNPAQQSIMVTCDDFEDQTTNPNGAGGTVLVRIYAIDGVGNFDYCETYVLVQNNLNQACGAAGPGTGEIAGLIRTEDNKAVENVTVQLSGQASQVKTTDVQGAYAFTNLQTGYDYSITPVKDNGYLNGVSTFDLVLISKHILGVAPLNTPYKLIAADVNNSKNISILDLIALRKLILSVDTEFANNTSWRFVDASYTFPVPTNPWSQAFPEVKNINDLASAITNLNFVAIKIGDIDGNARLNATASEVRTTNGTFHFNVADAQMVAGNEYRVAFTAAQIAAIQGYQATLTFDTKAVELVDIVSGVATEENFGLRYVNEGVITTSWNGEADANDVLFTLVLRAKSDVELSKVLGVSSRYTAAEAYNQASELMNVAIEFNSGAVVAAGFELYQNTPNPFKGQTVIGFNLPSAADATITISDITGKVVKLIRGSYAKGFNQEVLNSADLPTGVLTYTLQSGEFTATKKMVVIE